MYRKEFNNRVDCFNVVKKRFFLAVFLNIVVFELFISSFIYNYPELRNDDTFGWIPRDSSVKVQAIEGFARMRFNELGLRGRRIESHKEGEKRVFVMGSSYTFAGEVSERDTFVSLLDRRLNEKALPIMVINGGMPDASIAEYIYYLPVFQTIIKPDLIIIQIVAMDFYRALSRKSGIYIDLNNDGSYRVVDNREALLKYKVIENGLYRWLIEKSSIFSYLNIRMKMFLSMKVDAEAQQGPDKLNPAEQQKKNEILSRSVILMAKVLMDWAHNATPILLLLIPEENSLAKSMTHEEERLVDELKQLSSKYHIEVVDMAPIFRNSLQTDHIVPKGFLNSRPGAGHLNKSGHELVVDQLVPIILSRYRQ